MADENIFDNSSIRLPQPEEVTKSEREDAFGAYIMMFAALYFPIPLAEIPTSAAYYFYHKKRSRFVAFHALQSFLLQIPVSVVSFGVIVWGIVLGVLAVMEKPVGAAQLIPWGVCMGLVVALNIAYMVISLIAAMKAKKGLITYLPWSGQIAFNKVFCSRSADESSVQRNAPPNLPPRASEDRANS